MNTVLLIDPIYREHLAGRDHPERPERFDAVVEGLAGSRSARPVGPRSTRRAATEEELLLCHTPGVSAARRSTTSKQGHGYLSTGDTDVTPNSWDVAALRRGRGARMPWTRSWPARRAMLSAPCARPAITPTASRGMGFCLFNNVALAARYAQRTHGIERVLIVDWDVHHGNGTQDIFYHDPTVFFFSTHQWPLYPGTGRADETGDGAAEGPP